MTSLDSGVTADALLGAKIDELTVELSRRLDLIPAHIDLVTQAITDLGRLLAPLETLTTAVGQILAVLNEPDAGTSTGPIWGEQKVAVTGKAVILGNNPCNALVVQALPGNAANVSVGNQAVGQSNGYILAAGQAVGVIVTNLQQLSVNGTAGDGVCWLGT